MLKQIDRHITYLLRTVSDNPDIKALQKWVRVLTSNVARELRRVNDLNKAELALLHSSYNTLNIAVETLIELMDSEEDSQIYYGSGTYDVLSKARSIIINYEEFFTPAEESFTLSEELEKSLLALQDI